MELFKIATKIERLSIKADSFCCIASEVGTQRDYDRAIFGFADMFKLLSNEARELSEAIYEEARGNK